MNTHLMFATLLTDALHAIKRREGKTIAIIQDELGYALGRDTGGSVIEYWRKGHMPTALQELERLCELLRPRSGFDQTWFQQFLAAAAHPYPDEFCQRLFTAGASGPCSPLGIRPPVTDFTGRGQECATLVAALRQPAPTGRCIVIRGMGGVGKTELAHAAAEQVAGHFPDGVVLIPLRGMGDAPLTPAQALHTALRPFAGETALPDDPGALSGLVYRLLGAKRVLFLADDAYDADQVRGLAPPGGSALLITTRRRFTLPGATVLDLDPLAPAAAAALLTRICPRAAEHTPALSQACGYLPLALRVSASVLVNDDTYAVADYVATLADERTRLDGLRDPDDPDLDVAASLRLSVAGLPSAAQAGLRQLSVFPGSFDAAAAEAVVGLAGDYPARSLLSHLRRQNLLEYDSATSRFYLHDLVRAFIIRGWPDQVAGQPADLQPLELARQRHLAHYTDLALRAEAALKSSDQPNWLIRLDAELPNIRAAVEWSLDQGDAAAALPMVNGLYSFWQIRAYLAECRGWLERILPRAESAPLAEQAKGWKVLGIMAFRQGDYPAALAASTRSLDLYQQVGDAVGQVIAFMHLGLILHYQGQLTEAQQIYERALTLYYELPTPDPWLEGHLVNNLALIYGLKGDYGMSQRYLEKALELRRIQANQQGVILAQMNLGAAALVQGRYAQAAELLQESFTAVQQLGDELGIVECLEGLGILALEMDDPGLGRQHLEAALQRHRQMANQHGVGTISLLLGYYALITGELAVAEQWLATAQHIFAALGVLGQRVDLNRSRLALARREPALAWRWLRLAGQQALAIEIRPQILECAELAALLFAAAGDHGQATRSWQLAELVRQEWAIHRPLSLGRWYQTALPPLPAASADVSHECAPAMLLDLLTSLCRPANHAGRCGSGAEGAELPDANSHTLPWWDPKLPMRY